MQPLDNVITMHAKWAAKVFSGLKTIEVRKRKPPKYKTGWYGIAVKDIPDAIVGIVYISSWMADVSVEDVASLRHHTCIPDDDLHLYLKNRSSEYCWKIRAKEQFRFMIPFYSKGQTIKGVPRETGQPGVHHDIARIERMHEPDETSLLDLYKTWEMHQKNIGSFRRRVRAEIHASR